MGTNKCASQAGMTAYGTRRHLYDPKTQADKPFDQTTISLQMGTNKGASQVSVDIRPKGIVYQKFGKIYHLLIFESEMNVFANRDFCASIDITKTSLVIHHIQVCIRASVFTMLCAL